MPDSVEYLKKIEGLSQGDDFLAVQRQTPITLEQLIDGLSEQDLHRRPQPDKWAVNEIITHLAEDEIVTFWRYRRMLENPGCPLAGFDQDRWAELGNYTGRNARQSLTLFKSLRVANIELLDRLTEHEWHCHGVHAERGKITVESLARHMAGHDLNHVQQIRRILGQ
ncbi:MAG TPA: DinB family protein [Terriglobales bacterium]|nr:DinB family protein [Terriglobales bacterium]